MLSVWMNWLKLFRSVKRGRANFIAWPCSICFDPLRYCSHPFLFKITDCKTFCCLCFTRSGILNVSKMQLSLVKVSQAFRKYFTLPARVWFVLLTLSLLWTPLMFSEGTTHKGPLPLLFWNVRIVDLHLLVGQWKLFYCLGCHWLVKPLFAA